MYPARFLSRGPDRRSQSDDRIRMEIPLSPGEREELEQKEVTDAIATASKLNQAIVDRLPEDAHP